VAPPPPPQDRAGIGEWPVWGQEPPELWFRQVASHSLPATAPAVPVPAEPAPASQPASPQLAVPGFILGLIGACLGWIPLVGLACALFGGVFSWHARRAMAPGHPRRALATGGLVLGAIGVAFGMGASAILATVALNALFSALY
jgi:hypothetical protein